MRPLIKVPIKKPEDFAKKFWDQAEKAKSVEKIQEEQIFHLSEKEAQKCRYEIIDNTQRMAECTVHGYHGVRMHPPHLWDLKNGIVYQKVNNEWIKWFPNIKENLGRF